MLSPGNVEKFLEHKFTHLIIGGGTAGLVVAARLSENPSITVGVLEAGPPAFQEPLINIPGRFGEILGSKYDWKFETVPQAGINGKRLAWPRGKVLGGTSALNFMTWNRGCREDYDAWEELGNDGWGWEGMLPFFKKSEHFQEPTAAHQDRHHSHFDAEFHGREGPLHTVYSLEYGISHQYWHATLHEFGVPTNRSHFSGSNVGVWTSLTSVNPQSRERSYSATAYYKRCSERSNLVLLSEATVREVVLEEEQGGWVAKAVKFSCGGSEHVVRTDGEIILCAGSVQSPQLLELSGIGNSEILEAAGIELKVANANVGENLQDHMMTAMIYEIDPSIITPDDLRADPVLAEAADLTYATSQSGPRTAVPSSIAYLPLAQIIPADTLADLASSLPITHSPTLRETILARRLSPDSHLGHVEFNFDLSNYNPHYTSLPGKKYATMLQMLQYPFSKGSIHIPPARNGTPTTSNDNPVIDPKYYSGPGGAVDFRTMVAAQKLAHRICSTKPLSNIIIARVFPPPPRDDHADKNCNVEEQKEDFTAWVRDSTLTDWHPVGTCAMGRKGDGGVVDARLRVHGVRGLRVVDASVMPLQISAHIQATVYAIAEKGAAMILEDWEGRL